ncbi:PA2169 family four-helix-bundle protein [Puia sp.]|uniref:PA2169 family four-helix-bundle protein n=1 Tax=Puia sp. TaxID=2045100 RepID=UPI002F401485
MQNTRDTIEVLNDLIQINNDRIIGYEKAIRDTKPEDSDLKILFASMVAESHRMKIALATEVQTLGAEIEQGTTTSGKIYRAWMEVKAVFSGHNRHTILANCEAVEDAAQRAYLTAMKHDLPAFIHDLLNRQQDTLQASHEEVRSLRDQYA